MDVSLFEITIASNASIMTAFLAVATSGARSDSRDVVLGMRDAMNADLGPPLIRILQFTLIFAATGPPSDCGSRAVAGHEHTFI